MDELLTRVPVEARNRKPIRWFTRPPWKHPANIVVFDEVPEVASRDDDTELKRFAAEAQYNWILITQTWSSTPTDQRTTALEMEVQVW